VGGVFFSVHERVWVWYDVFLWEGFLNLGLASGDVTVGMYSKELPLPCPTLPVYLSMTWRFIHMHFTSFSFAHCSLTVPLDRIGSAILLRYVALWYARADIRPISCLRRH